MDLITQKQKIYLSAIIDLYDRRIVSYVLSNSNNNKLVFDTFGIALKEIQVLNHYSIVIEDFNTQLNNSNLN